MEKSKNLGITRPCPNCKKTIIKSVNFMGDGSFETKCVHCGSLVKVNLASKRTVSLSVIIVAIVIVGGIVMFGTLFKTKNSLFAGGGLTVLLNK